MISTPASPNDETYEVKCFGQGYFEALSALEAQAGSGFATLPTYDATKKFAGRADAWD
jgi:hypothetical protein